jgi:HEAT repeats
MQYTLIRRAVIALAASGAFLTGAAPAAAQLPRVGIIDFYGLRKTTAAQAREALGISVGDSLTSLALMAVPARLADLPGVVSAAIDPVCCEEGKTMLYVGVLEEGAPVLELRRPPNGKSRLPAEVIQAGVAFARAHERAVMRGFVKEDVTQGHSLMADSTARMVQLRFVELAAKHRDSLRAVLRTADDEDHRGLAAEVLAYSANKQDVVADLVYAMRDPSSEVRNNATRALALIAMYGQQHPELKIAVPHEPFVDLLNSVAWTDRNKASLALIELTEGRNPTLMTALKTRAFDAMVDIAQWTNPGHAMAGIILLGRIAGMPDAEIFAAYERGERDKIIDAARKARS